MTENLRQRAERVISGTEPGFTGPRASVQLVRDLLTALEDTTRDRAVMQRTFECDLAEAQAVRDEFRRNASLAVARENDRLQAQLTEAESRERRAVEWGTDQGFIAGYLFSSVHSNPELAREQWQKGRPDYKDLAFDAYQQQTREERS